MFNFGKKEVMNPVVVKPTSRSKQVSVQEIHRDFMCAGDQALEEMNEIISTADRTKIEDYERLSKVGFAKTKKAVEGYFEHTKLQNANALSKRIQDYAQRYPLYKFITDLQVKKLCEKYQLTLGAVGSYILDIPEKNLKEIENFKLDKKDYISTNRDHLMNSWDREAVFMYYDGNTHIYKSFDFSSQEKNETGLYRAKLVLEICAPREHFDMQGKKLVDGYRLEEIPKDPIVLQPLGYGGYLIITAWGAEASDEMVVNEKMN